MYGTEIK